MCKAETNSAAQARWRDADGGKHAPAAAAEARRLDEERLTAAFQAVSVGAKPCYRFHTACLQDAPHVFLKFGHSYHRAITPLHWTGTGTANDISAPLLEVLGNHRLLSDLGVSAALQAALAVPAAVDRLARVHEGRLPGLYRLLSHPDYGTRSQVYLLSALPGS